MEEDEWLKNLDFHNISAQSLGEVNPDKRLENIENKVKEAVLFTNKLKEKSKLIPLEKFLPILNNVNTISQHNYNVSQSLLIQNRHLQEKLYKVNEDLKCFKNERDHFKSKMEENLRTSNLEIKILSNENDKIKTVMSNYRLENEMLKDILSEKTEIISKKEENLLRLERELQHLSQQNQSNRLKYEEDIAFLTQKYTKNQEEIHILSLNINSKDSEIVRLRDISLLEKKELENEIIRLNSDFLAYKNELVLEKKKLDKLEKTTYAQKCENENIERNSHEKEEKIIKLEKELTEMKENLFKKEKTFINDIEERVHEVQANNIDQIVGLEVKLNQMLQKEEGLENKIEDLINENRELQVKLEEEISEKNYIELQWKVYAEERAKLLADFGEVKKKYEQLIDSQERELKACRFKVWEYENKCDSYKTEIERLKGKEKILNNLGKFRNEQLDSYLKLNVHFHDAYQDVGPSQIDSAQKQAKTEFKTIEKVSKEQRSLSNHSDNQDTFTNKNLLNFKDLDKEWEMINSAISNINNKYQDNLTFLQK